MRFFDIPCVSCASPFPCGWMTGGPASSRASGCSIMTCSGQPRDAFDFIPRRRSMPCVPRAAAEMSAAYHTALDASKNFAVNMRQAAYAVAGDRVSGGNAAPRVGWWRQCGSAGGFEPTSSVSSERARSGMKLPKGRWMSHQEGGLSFSLSLAFSARSSEARYGFGTMCTPTMSGYAPYSSIVRP
jgi:hypothetical protein